jgi:hypothetical protein
MLSSLAIIAAVTAPHEAHAVFTALAVSADIVYSALRRIRHMH